MRVWGEDGVVDPEAVSLGEFILKCGLARFPNNATLLIAFANFQLEVRLRVGLDCIGQVCTAAAMPALQTANLWAYSTIRLIPQVD